MRYRSVLLTSLVIGAPIASVVGFYCWAWHAHSLSRCGLELRGMAVALAAYIDLNDGAFPDSLEALRNAGIIEPVGNHGLWRATETRVPPDWVDIPYPFSPDHLVVKWGYRLVSGEAAAEEPLVRHVRLRDTDRGVVLESQRIREYMREKQRPKATMETRAAARP